MTGKEKLERLEREVSGIVAHFNMAVSRLQAISSHHDISTRMEEDIELLMAGPLEDVVSDVKDIPENFKCHLENIGELDEE